MLHSGRRLLLSDERENYPTQKAFDYRDFGDYFAIDFWFRSEVLHH